MVHPPFPNSNRQRVKKTSSQEVGIKKHLKWSFQRPMATLQFDEKIISLRRMSRGAGGAAAAEA
jgi:hypothetical protein